tara:strand:+ start:10777 stop:11796 length:1020 start_codon:yes stop_codon:yes gene_type:complete
MTALDKYQRIEALGLWRNDNASQRKDVLISIGETTLLISDMQEQPLAHWSLAAIERANPGNFPAIYHPDGDQEESLELNFTEKEMIDAIEKLRTVIARRRPHPGRLRTGIFLGIFSIVFLTLVLWMPQAVRNYTAEILPEVKHVEIGNKLFEHLKRVTGPACQADFSKTSLKLLSERLFAEKTPIFIVPDGIKTTINLPGNILLANRNLVEDFEDPDVLAGFLVIEKLRSQTYDPMEDLIQNISLLSTFRLLTTGLINDETLMGYADYLVTKPQETIQTNKIIKAFHDTKLSLLPFAKAIDITGEGSFELIEADEIKKSPVKTSLPDAYWVSLQNICNN